MGTLRVQKDMQDLKELSEAEWGYHLDFPDANNLLEMVLSLRPPEGMYAGTKVDFSIVVDAQYPCVGCPSPRVLRLTHRSHKAPKVKCKPTILHPNIDLEGNVCLNILREDWKPVLNLKAVIAGMCMLFLTPNPEDPLNKDAAKHMLRDKSDFARVVRRACGGAYINGVNYDRILL